MLFNHLGANFSAAANAFFKHAKKPPVWPLLYLVNCPVEFILSQTSVRNHILVHFRHRLSTRPYLSLSTRCSWTEHITYKQRRIKKNILSVQIFLLSELLLDLLQLHRPCLRPHGLNLRCKSPPQQGQNRACTSRSAGSFPTTGLP